MRILVHDYAGHALHVQLSRALAARGHSVLHLYCGSNQSPRGAVQRASHDPPGFAVKGLELRSPIRKYSYVMRRFQEGAYGRLLARVVRDFKAEVAISGNTPLDVQVKFQRACDRQKTRFVFWVQDLLSVGMSRILGKKFPLLGAMVGRHYESMERGLLGRSDQVVTISEDFSAHLQAWGVSPDKVTCIPNWGPLEEVKPRSKSNPWAARHGVADRFCFLYAGTLGLKHNPQLLLSLAKSVASEGAVVIVASEGLGAEWLKRETIRQGVENLRVVDFQPYGELSDMLGAADVLVAILEPYAGVFSIPSKVLTYLCAERPLLLAVPRENLAARIAVGSDAGRVADPEDETRFVQGALELLRDSDVRRRLGKNARSYAESNFGIGGIADKFEWVIEKARQGL